MPARAHITPTGPVGPLKGSYFVKRAGKRVRLVGAGVAGRKGGDPWVARRPVPLPLRPCPHGRRKRPHSTPHLSRPYGMEEMRPKPFRRDGANSLGALQKTGSE